MQSTGILRRISACVSCYEARVELSYSIASWVWQSNLKWEISGYHLSVQVVEKSLIKGIGLVNLRRSA